jgi:hypothetical protein
MASAMRDVDGEGIAWGLIAVLAAAMLYDFS